MLFFVSSIATLVKSKNTDLFDVIDVLAFVVLLYFKWSLSVLQQ